MLAERKQRFLNELDDELRRGCTLLITLAATLFPAFFFLDFLTQPQYVISLAAIRIVTSLFYAGLFVAIRKKRLLAQPVILSFVVLGIAAASISFMCVALGGYKSPYYAGVNLVILAAGLIFPWGARRMAWAVGMIISIYLSLVLIQAGFKISDHSAFINNLYFILGTGIISVAGANLSYRKRLESFKRVLNFEHSQSELARSSSFLNTLFENLPNMVFVKDAQELRFVQFNKAGEDLIGVKRELLIGKNDYDFFPKDQADAFTSKDRAVLEGSQVIDVPEEQISTKDRGIRILHTKKMPLLGEDGTPNYLLGISEDITDTKLAATKRANFLSAASGILATSLDYHKALHDLTKILVPDICDWVTMSIQKDKFKFERVVAVHRDASKENIMERLKKVPPINPDHSGAVEKVIRTGESHLVNTPGNNEVDSHRVDEDVASEDHKQILQEIGLRHYLIVAIRGQNKILGAISLFNTESDRRFTVDDQLLFEELGRRVGSTIENALLYEQAREAITARDEFLSVASHELKTPITSLSLQLQFARRAAEGPNLDSPQNHAVLGKAFDVSLRQVARLTGLVEDLLDVSRIGAGKLLYHYEPADLTAVVFETLERHKEQLRVAGSSVTFDGSKPVIAECDRFRIEQVVSNLLTNAAKYGQGKPVVISVRQTGDAAMISVEDFGMGIPEDRIEKIFERFERGVAPKGISGLGLGLYISKEIVSNHGGQIKVESHKGKGSTFTVILPLKHVFKTQTKNAPAENPITL